MEELYTGGNSNFKKFFSAFIILLLIAIIYFVVAYFIKMWPFEESFKARIISKKSNPERMKARIMSKGALPREGMCGVPHNGGNYEAKAEKALRENQEYFSVCGSEDTKAVLDCVCEGNEGKFAKFEYGRPDSDYKDFVASWAIDDKVIENHMKFVRDRKGLGPEGEFVTGRTYSPDSHDSYDPIPWVGIRGRPHAPADLQCNPTQVPDIDTNLYRRNRPYCFWT